MENEHVNTASLSARVSLPAEGDSPQGKIGGGIDSLDVQGCLIASISVHSDYPDEEEDEGKELSCLCGAKEAGWA